MTKRAENRKPSRFRPEVPNAQLKRSIEMNKQMYPAVRTKP